MLTHDYSIVTAMRAAGEHGAGLPLVGDVFIGVNTFIGLNSIILPGTIIGKNVIVAAGAVVSGTVEDNAIVAGVPGRVIGQTQDMAKKMISGTRSKRVQLPSGRARFVFIKN